MNIRLSIVLEFEVDDEEVKDRLALGRIRREANQFTYDLPDLLNDNRDLFISNIESTVSVDEVKS